MTKKDAALIIDVIVDYEFYDEFTDPVSIRENVLGRSLENVPGWIVDMIGEETLLGLSDISGTIYPITGSWQTRLTAVIDEDPAKSMY